MNSDNVQKTLDSKKVEHKEEIVINILFKKAQTSQNVVGRFLMILAFDTDSEVFRDLFEIFINSTSIYK